MGNPAAFYENVIGLKVGRTLSISSLLNQLVSSLYTRNDVAPKAGNFRVKGDTVDIYLAYSDDLIRVCFWDDEIDSIEEVDVLSGTRLNTYEEYKVYPANLFLTSKETQELAIRKIQDDLVAQVQLFEEMGKTLEAKRLKERVEYDIEMIRELGHCAGIENYSRYFDGREPNTRPFCLLDFFPDDFLIVMLLNYEIDTLDHYNVYLDIKDTLSAVKVRRLREILNVKYGVFRNVQNIVSKESLLMQLADFIMGAISYNANDDLKRNKAKVALIEKIKKHTQLVDLKETNRSEKLNLFFINLK